MIPLGTEPSPGLYRMRMARKSPWLPVRVVEQDGLWFVLVAGKVTTDSGKADPFEVSLLLHQWPLHPVDEVTYLALLAEVEAAQPGTPMATPDQSVDLRQSRSLW